MNQLLARTTFESYTESDLLSAFKRAWGFELSDINWDNISKFVELVEPIMIQICRHNDEDDSEKKPPYNWVLDYIVSERYRARLRLLILLSCTQIISIKKLMQELTASISLIFGMCGSCVSFIYSAIFGNSSNRIFSI